METPELVNIPIAILWNKIDLSRALSEEELKEAHHYDELLAREAKLFMVSITKKMVVLSSFRMDSFKITRWINSYYV